MQSSLTFIELDFDTMDKIKAIKSFGFWEKEKKKKKLMNSHFLHS